MDRTTRVPDIVWQAILFEGSLFVLAVLLGWLFRFPPLPRVHLTWTGLFVGIVAALPLVLAMLWSLRTRAGPFARLRQQVDEIIVPLFAKCDDGHLLLISILAGLGEETLFRGLMQPAIAAALGPLSAVIVTSVIFGMLHLITPLYALLGALIGAYWGWLALATDNLLVPIVVHALYDFIALEVMVRRLHRRRGAGFGAAASHGHGTGA
jgi:membrane protease YdiL (CAAX protease family)